MTLPRTRRRALTAAHIQWMRDTLRESTQEFAKRWHVSHRTVETWEQGTRSPNRWLAPRILALYRALESGELR